jgi:hypothetical protein
MFFRVPPNKEQATTSYVVGLVDQLHDIYHYAHQQLKVAVTGWRPAMTAWPILQDSRNGTSLALPSDPDQRNVTCHPGKAHSKWSRGSTTWSTWSSYIQRQRWWWYTWTDWRLTWGLLGMSSLKEGAVSQISPFPPAYK